MKGYGPIPNPDMLLSAVAKYLDSIVVKDAGLGDILLLRFERDPHHFAIISNLEPLQVIHAYADVRRVCETPLDGYWRQKIKWRNLILSAWRFREMAFD
jgi:hypothetical protein